ncbi:MAG: MraY family glycosyltransferase [Pseudomonadota bacterium]|jgi:UDP-GlcNAc:undecaprenyl-phosphate GlcNAc-1-phosphate transferase
MQLDGLDDVISVVTLTVLYVATALTAMATFLLRSQAGRLGLLDRPGGHKAHEGAVPVVGGLAMWIGFAAALLVPTGHWQLLGPLIGGASVLVLLGAYDDAQGLTPRLRLLSHAVVATLVIYAIGPAARLETLGDFVGMGPVALGLWSLPFTVFVMVAAINAFNMLDGLDGLAGGVAFAIALVLLVAMGTGLRTEWAPVLTALVGVTAAFLCFNAPMMLQRPARIFMGDAGSTFLGFTLALVLVSVCQGADPLVSPVNAIWCLFVPATEVLQSTVRRLLSGRSPFAPDRGHLHHQLLAAGYAVRTIFFLYIGVSVLGCVLAQTFQYLQVPDAVSFVVLLLASATCTGLVHAQTVRARSALIEEQHSVLAASIGDVPHVGGVVGLDQRHYRTERGVLSTLTNPNEPVRPTFVTPEFGPPDVEPAADSDVA